MTHELIPVTIAGAFTFGMILALLGSIKLPLAQRLGMDEARIGGLLSALNLALIPLMLVSGILVDHLGVRGMLIAGSLGACLAIFGLAMSRTFAGCLYAILLVGAAGACISTAAIKLMPAAFFDSKAASLNLGNVFFGLGALVTPTLADLLIRGIGFRRTVSLLAVFCLISALAALLTDSRAFERAFPHQEARTLWEVLQDPTLWLAGLVFLLYSPLEGALATWATTYLTQLGFREFRAALLLSGFWLAFLAGRLVMSLFQQTNVATNSEPWVILVLALAAAVCLGNLAGTHNRASAAWGLLLTGAALGPIFPTLVGILFNHFESEQGTAYGAMFAVGAMGSLILAPVIGVYAQRRSVRAALRIPTVVALLLAGASLVMALTLL
jgi:FHS family glucose/mannose:H+ symporter-like MFS transporter